MQCLSAAHAFDNIALRINPGLTSCKEFAKVMDISPNNNHSSCNASYVLPYRLGLKQYSNSLGIRSIVTLFKYPLDIRIKIFGIMRVYACVFVIFIKAHCLWRVAQDICVV